MIASASQSANSVPLLDVVKGLISKAMSSQEELNQLASESYLHPNKFIKVSLGNLPTGEGLRLHKWPLGFKDTSAHSHRWDMTALILQGSYRLEDFAESSLGMLVDKYKCSQNKGGLYTIVASGQACISRVRTDVMSPNGLYVLPFGTIHRLASLGDEEVISIVQTSPPQDATSFIFCTPGHIPANDDPVALGPAELLAFLEQVHRLVCERRAP